MPYNAELPVWAKIGTKPPLTMLNTTGWQAGDKPPADWLNYLFNTSYLVLKELQEKSLNVDQKGAVSGVASLGADGKVPASQLPPSNATASAISITDTGNYYTGTNAELALQEVGQMLNATRGNLVTSVNTVLGS